jgi:protein SCO1/2
MPFLILLLFVGIGCKMDAPQVIQDLGNHSTELINQHDEKVVFTEDFHGQPFVISYIFTSCNNVCPAITANMKEISERVDPNSPVHFVLLSFDPKRDTPEQLRAYRQEFELDEERFTLLTGDSTTVYNLLDTVGIRAEVMPGADMSGNYMFNHSNEIQLYDAQGRMRGEYGGTMTDPEIIIEDLMRL